VNLVNFRVVRGKTNVTNVTSTNTPNGIWWFELTTVNAADRQEENLHVDNPSGH
jgi:hypothetical protein